MKGEVIRCCGVIGGRCDVTEGDVDVIGGDVARMGRVTSHVAMRCHGGGVVTYGDSDVIRQAVTSQVAMRCCGGGVWLSHMGTVMSWMWM